MKLAHVLMVALAMHNLYREIFPAHVKGCAIKDFHMTADTTVINAARPFLDKFWSSSYAPHACSTPKPKEPPMNYFINLTEGILNAVHKSSYALGLYESKWYKSVALSVYEEWVLLKKTEWIDVPTQDEPTTNEVVQGMLKLLFDHFVFLVREMLPYLPSFLIFFLWITFVGGGLMTKNYVLVHWANLFTVIEIVLYILGCYVGVLLNDDFYNVTGCGFQARHSFAIAVIVALPVSQRPFIWWPYVEVLDKYIISNRYYLFDHGFDRN